MASVFQPFQDVLGELGRDLMRSDLGRDFLVRPLGMAGSAAGNLAGQVVSRIRLDVDEDDTAYTIRAEIPGARKEDIQVSVEGAQVSLSAEIPAATHDGAGQHALYRERTYGRVSRSFALPQEVDSQAAAGQYRDGVLTLVLPKKAASSGRRVPIG
jgi:HSP20 family protein